MGARRPGAAHNRDDAPETATKGDLNTPLNLLTCVMKTTPLHDPSVEWGLKMCLLCDED